MPIPDQEVTLTTEPNGPPDTVEGYSSSDGKLGGRVLRDFQLASSARLFQESKVFVRALFNSRSYYLPGSENSTTTSQAAVNATRPKLQTAAALLMPIVVPPGSSCFTIDPDPEAVDPKEAWALLKSGVPPDTARDILFQKAGVKADRINAKITKANDFGRMNDKLMDFLWHLSTFGTGVMMGPLGVKNPEVFTGPEEDGDEDDNTKTEGSEPPSEDLVEADISRQLIEAGFLDEFLPNSEVICPLDFYPDPAASNPNMLRFFIYRMTLGKAQLMGMMTDKTFRRDAVEEVLEQHPNGVWQPTYWETAVNALNNQPQQTVPNGRYICYQWWGFLTGKDLADNGVKDIPESRMEERVVAQIWVIGGKIIKIAVSELHNERLPIYVTPFSKAVNSIWGVGIAEMMFDSHDAIQATERALMDNMALMMAPQMVVDIDQLADPFTVLEIKPRKIWGIRGKIGAQQKPVEFFTPQCALQEILAIQRNEFQLADEQTGMPQFLQGQQGAGVHNRTLGGANLQFNNSLTTLKTAVYNIENTLIVPHTQSQIRFIQMYSKDPQVQGSFLVSAHGVKGLLAREALVESMAMLLQNIGNMPQLADRLKMSNFFSSYLRYTGLVNEDLVYSDSEYQEIQKQKAEEAQKQAAYSAGIQASVQAQPKLRAELPLKDALMDMAKEAPEGSELKIAFLHKAAEAFGISNDPEVAKAFQNEQDMAGIKNQNAAHELGHAVANREMEPVGNPLANHPHLLPPLPTAKPANGSAR